MRLTLCSHSFRSRQFCCLNALAGKIAAKCFFKNTAKQNPEKLNFQLSDDLSRTKQLVQPMVSFLIFDVMSCGVGAPKLRPMHEVFPARGLSRRNYSLQDLNTVL